MEVSPPKITKAPATPCEELPSLLPPSPPPLPPSPSPPPPSPSPPPPPPPPASPPTLLDTNRPLVDTNLPLVATGFSLFAFLFVVVICALAWKYMQGQKDSAVSANGRKKSPSAKVITAVEVEASSTQDGV